MSLRPAPAWLAAALLLSLLAACVAEETLPDAGPQNTATPRATRTARPSPSPTLHPSLIRARVSRVIDGDTIEVSIKGRLYKVRYTGIDTPETVDPRRPVQCFGREASERNRELVEGETVGLEKDISETDHFGRLLRYVWVGGRMVNALLVKGGFATAATYPPDVKYADLFLQLQRKARDAGRGLWGACYAATPVATSGGGVCDYSDSSQPVIKGNISYTTGEKIYHVPGGEFYDETVIDKSNGERWFCTEEQAVAAGWRKSFR
ncbi:MAG: thermonuclease family protein [Chloroflexi bacterium]|nr:thermonuclease family protein [Chloroflexota bacterium]